MENNEKLFAENLEQASDDALDAASGGGGGKINYVICCTCGAQVPTNHPTGAYYNNNICPYCHGRLKSW